uniref:Col_cuticle_N domain-containing protein n=1 Tax=Strongyloides stercoralis TaxID=6248 RepID=A0A0K0ESX1_STRER
MVQSYQSPVYIYKYPFELIMAAYEMRFPTCPQIPIFVGCEVTNEKESEDKSYHMIERKCELNIDIPYLLKKIAKIELIYFKQTNFLYRSKRLLKIDAENISFSNRISIHEECKYYVHPENENWTCFEQKATLDVKSFFGFESAVEKLAIKHYTANINKGKEIMQVFIDELAAKGITEVPRWKGIEINNENKKNSEMCTSITNDMFNECEAESKLEAEYIRRFLGQLTPLEESRLCELKYGLQDVSKGKLPNDAHLLRFLRARDFDVSKARDMVISSLLWRKQHNIDKILHEFTPPSVLKQFFPGSWHYKDKCGRPLYIIRLGHMDVKGILRAVGLNVLTKFILSICEEGLEKTTEATKELGKPISTWTLLVDLEGLSMRHLWRPGVHALLKIIEIVEANYPETMGLVLITRAPRVFPVLWTLISPFINENTRKKFMVNSNEHIVKDLKKYIDENYLPTFLSGNCFFSASSGGHVPKNLYLPSTNLLNEEDDLLTSIYITGNIYRSIPVENFVKVSTPGCVLTWDFDILKGECEFLIYYCPSMLDAPIAHSPTINAVDRVSASISGPTSFSHPIHAYPNLSFDNSIKIVEKPLLFSEGDSMQGSHYCSQSGTYILQWRHQEPPNNQHYSFDFSLSGHKCKLMYYSELLNSTDFRGSVASLESCHSSSFNSLVGNSPHILSDRTLKAVKKEFEEKKN